MALGMFAIFKGKEREIIGEIINTDDELIAVKDLKSKMRIVKKAEVDNFEEISKNIFEDYKLEDCI